MNSSPAAGNPPLHGISWLLLLLLALAALALGIVGFLQYAEDSSNPATITYLDAFYRALQLFTLESGAVDGRVPWTLEIARFLAPLVAATTAIKAVLGFVQDQWQGLRLANLRHHTVICGGGRKGTYLAERLRSAGREVVLIEIDPDAPTIPAARASGAFLLFGDATHASSLRAAQITHADEVMIITGNDGLNVAIYDAVQALCDGRKGPHRYVHLVDPELRATLEARAKREQHANLDLTDAYSIATSDLLDSYFALRSHDATRRPAHLVICGFGKMGQSLALRFAEHPEAHRMGTPTITVFDRDGRDGHGRFLLRHADDDLANLKPTFIGGPVEAESTLLAILDLALDPATDTLIALCLDSDERNLSCAIGLQQAINRKRDAATSPTPIYVRLASDSGLEGLSQSTCSRDNPLCGIHFFGMLRATCHPDKLMPRIRS